MSVTPAISVAESADDFFGVLAVRFVAQGAAAFLRLCFWRWPPDGLLSGDLLSRLVFAKALERRVTEQPFVRPFGELDFAHELGLHPRDAASLRGRERGVERRVGDAAFLEIRVKFLERLVGEPRAHAAA